MSIPKIHVNETSSCSSKSSEFMQVIENKQNEMFKRDIAPHRKSLIERVTQAMYNDKSETRGSSMPRINTDLGNVT